MKRVKTLLFGILLVLLLGVATTSAQGPMDPMDPDQGQHHPQIPGHMMGPGGFEGGTDHLIIEGNISVDQDILLSITITPDTESMNNARDHAMPYMPDELSNEIKVHITKLVEYKDLHGDGFDYNDTMISEYLLNNENLEEPILVDTEEETYYEITSSDEIFDIIIYLRTDNGVGRGWKWSVDINYPFQSDNSSLAILQSVESTLGPIAHRHQHHNMLNQPEKSGEFVNPPRHMRINDTHLQDGHPEIPMFFKWDEFAIVDSVNESVIATLNDGQIALSFVQGSDIFYDPEIGVEEGTISDVESLIDQFDVTDFVDTVNSPTVLGILIASGLVLGTIIISRIRKMSLR